MMRPTKKPRRSMSATTARLSLATPDPVAAATLANTGAAKTPTTMSKQPNGTRLDLGTELTEPVDCACSVIAPVVWLTLGVSGRGRATRGRPAQSE